MARSIRYSRSDKGTTALAKSIFQDILGLNASTSERLFSIIKNQGQLQDMKLAIRTMSGVSHRRLNDIIDRMDRLDTDPARTSAGIDDDHDHDHDDHDDHDHEMIDRETALDQEEAPVRESFASYLLSELQYDDEDLRDPEKKQEIMRLMRAGDAQADQLVKRGTQKQKQDARQEIQQETDPRKSNLRRKRQRLTKQITMIDKDLGDKTETDTEPTI